MTFSMQDEVASPILSELTQGLAPVGAVVERRALAEVTADDVLLIIDMQHDFLPGGNFGVAEGDQCIKPVVRLIDAFARAGASVVATRDYHPIDHCSFEAQGGPFPQHCVQGTKGAFLHDDVAAALQPLVASGQALIAFKAFARDLDSFGAFEYTPSAAPGRLCRRNACALSWSGSFLLFASNAVHDCNAPPDVMAVMSRQPLANVIRPKAGRKLYVCGLAFDFCVADTALNARAAGFDHVSIILGATRAAHLNGTFVNPPATVGGRLVEGGVSLVDFE